MKKLLYGLIALFLVGVAIASPGHLGVYQTKNWLGFPIYALDTTAGLRHRPDSVYLYVYFGRLANASSFTARSANPVSETYIDSFKTSSQAEATFMYHDSVGRIDADSGNGNYWALLQTYYQTKITDFSFQFTVVDSPYATSLRKAAADSANVDGSNLAGLTGAISATTMAADAIGSSEIATDAIGAAEIGAGAIVAGTEATGFSTLTATDNIGINWADITNPTTAQYLSGTDIKRVDSVRNVMNIASTDTLTTVLGNVNGNVAGSVASVTAGVALTAAANASVADSVWGVAFTGGTSNVAAVTGSIGDSLNNSSYVGIVDWAKVNNATTTVGLSGTTILAATTAVNLTTNNDKTGYALTTAYPDSSGLSRILGRKLFGIPAGTGSDSLTKAQRIVGASQASDTINAHAPHGNNFASTGASAVTPDTIRDILGDSLATFATPHALTDSMRLVAHDSTRLFVQGVKDKTDSLKFAGVMSNPSFSRFSNTGDSVLVKISGLALGQGNFAPDYATSAGTTSLYPFLERIITVDAVGAITTQQFVIDSTSTGGSNELGLINKAVTIRDADDGLYLASGVLERVNCVAANCTLQVADALPFAVEAGDSIFVWGAEPSYVFATLSEAAARGVDSLINRDMTGVPQDSLFGGLLKIAALNASSTLDTTGLLQLYINHGWYVAFDSLVVRVQNTLAQGLPTNGQLITIPTLDTAKINVNIEEIKGDTASASGLKEAFDVDAIGYGRLDYVDSAGNAIASGGSSGCPDSVGNAWTIVAWDSVNNVAVPSAFVTLKSTASSVTSLAQAKSGFTFTAASGTYYVAIEANNVTFPIRSFAVSTSRTDTINGGGFTVLTPSAPNLCALQGYIKDLNNNPIAGALVTFTLSSSLDTLRYGGSEFTTGSKQVYTSSTGYFSTELVPNTLLDANSYYIYKVAKSGVMGLPKERKIVVPNSGSANIDDL